MQRSTGARLFGAAVIVLGGIVCGAVVRGDVLWTENAEGGLANVIDHTSASYPLIQANVVGEGAYAFHLAHPAAPTDEWFVLSPTITPQADSKLFFLSRLAAATPAQVAKVQISTNGGASWPTTIYSQAGADQPGEGAFTLKEVDLSPYANQNLQFRFYYDFTGGQYYPQTSPGVGWYIDNIQIADHFQKLQYSIGNPSDEAQLYLEYINRARADALAEAQRLASETDPDITSAYSFFGVTGANIINQFQWYVNQNHEDFAQYAQPLSFNEKLNTAALLHSQDMFAHQFQGHDSSSNPPAPLTPFGSLGDRLDAVGYNGSAGENVYSYASSPREGHAAFDVDWGHVTNFGDFYNPAFNGQGMQNQAGHRLNIHNPSFKEIGIGVVNGVNESVGPQIVTQDFGDPGDVTFVTGVVYEDLNGNAFYDIGEGRSGVRIDVEGSAYFAVSSDSGGYSVPVQGDGVYNVLFSGGGFGSFMTTANIVGGANVKIDYIVSPILFAADFNNDGMVDGADLAKWQSDFGANANSDADGDGDTDGADFLAWQQQFGSGGAVTVASAAVPEPVGALMFVISAVGAAIQHARMRRMRGV